MNLGLRAKLTAPVAALMVVLAGFFVAYYPVQESQTAMQSLQTRAKNVALALSSAMAPALSSDPADVQARLWRFATHKSVDPDVAFIVIRSPDKNELTSYVADDLQAQLQAEPALAAELARRTRLTDVDTPVRVETEGGYTVASVSIFRDAGGFREYLGTLSVGLSQATVDEAKSHSRTQGIVFGLLIVLVGVAVGWLTSGGITTPILQAARKLDEVSSDLATAARDQEASSAEEAAAVAQTRRSMETLLNSAQQIADRSSQVLGNAERSTKGSREIADRIGNLNELSEKVTDILATIMQVADKADLLALNASLEGTRAGDAGKGFALVAAEMRRLAENVIESVSGIRALMNDMLEASQAAVTASEEGTRSSTATTHSAREIALLTQEQRQATEQVIASMDEMGEILSNTLDGIQRTTTSASQVMDVAAILLQIVNPSDSTKPAQGGQVRQAEQDGPAA